MIVIILWHLMNEVTIRLYRNIIVKWIKILKLITEKPISLEQNKKSDLHYLRLLIRYYYDCSYWITKRYEFIIMLCVGLYNIQWSLLIKFIINWLICQLDPKEADTNFHVSVISNTEKNSSIHSFHRSLCSFNN